MTMRLSLCKFCQYASRLADGRPLIIGIFSRMATSGFPVMLDPCCLAIEIETGPQDSGRSHRIELRLIDEDGRQLTHWSGDLELDESQEPNFHHTFFSVDAPWDEKFVFLNEGAYRVDVVRIREDESEDVLGGETLYVSLVS